MSQSYCLQRLRCAIACSVSVVILVLRWRDTQSGRRQLTLGGHLNHDSSVGSRATSPTRELDGGSQAGRCETRSAKPRTAKRSTERQIGPVMRLRQIVAASLAALMASIPILTQEITAQQAPPTATIAGVAKKEAKKPFSNYTTRARDVQTGVIAGTATNADPDANFTISGLPPASSSSSTRTARSSALRARST